MCNKGQGHICILVVTESTIKAHATTYGLPKISLLVYLPCQCWLYTTSVRRSHQVIIMCFVGAYNRHPFTAHTMQRDEIILTSWPVSPNRTLQPFAILRLTVSLKRDPNPLIQLPICAQFLVILTAFSVPLFGFQQGLAFAAYLATYRNLKKRFFCLGSFVMVTNLVRF